MPLVGIRRFPPFPNFLRVFITNGINLYQIPLSTSVGVTGIFLLCAAIWSRHWLSLNVPASSAPGAAAVATA